MGEHCIHHGIHVANGGTNFDFKGKISVPLVTQAPPTQLPRSIHALSTPMSNYENVPFYVCLRLLVKIKCSSGPISILLSGLGGDVVASTQNSSKMHEVANKNRGTKVRFPPPLFVDLP